MKAYTTRSNARRAAIAAASVKTGIDKAVIKQDDTAYFSLTTATNGFAFKLTSPVAAPATKVGRSYKRNGNVAKCWNIFDSNKDQGLRRKDMIEKCVQSGINFFTGRTQYQAWFTACKAS